MARGPREPCIPLRLTFPRDDANSTPRQVRENDLLRLREYLFQRHRG